MNRQQTLDAAAHAVMGAREAQYSPPENNFARIAAMWAAYKGVPFQAHDVAAMLALLKLARIATSPAYEDSWVDLAGYAACGAEVATKPPSPTLTGGLPPLSGQAVGRNTPINQWPDIPHAPRHPKSPE